MADQQANLFNILSSGRTKINLPSIAEFIQSPDGPVVRQLMITGDVVKQATIHLLREGFPRNFIGPSIVKRFVTTPQGPTVLVGSDRLKTRPHVIRGNPTLVFNWPKAGGVVFFRSVNHPGSNFGAYLSKKLLEAVAATKGIR